MNERIKQLADEAGLKYHNWITNESNINDGDFKYPRLEDYEKFAELIVQECISINRQRMFSDYEGDSLRVAHNNALLCATSDMFEHFGVEE